MKILICILSFFTTCLAQVNTDPKSLVENFCASEFSGDMNTRFNLTIYSIAKRKEFTKLQNKWQTALDPAVINPNEDPVLIGSSYNIETIHTQNGRGYAKIKYIILGETYSKTKYTTTTDVRKLKNRILTIKINIIQNSNKLWYVENPIKTIISREAMINIYTIDLDRISETIKKNKNTDLIHLKLLADHKIHMLRQISAL